MPEKIDPPEWRIMDAETRGGDWVEKEYWPIIGKAFPNYELFWSHVIVPLTERPSSIGPKPQNPEILGRLSEAHYSIFLHLAAAFSRASAHPQQLLAYEEAYSHLATVCDVLIDFVFLLYEIISGDQLKMPEEIKTQEGFRDYLSSWAMSKQAEVLLKGFHNKNRVHSFSPFKNDEKKTFEFLTGSKKGLWSQYEQVRGKIRPTRNTFMHEAARAKISLNDGRIMFPKDVEALKNYDTWQKVHSAASDPSILKNDFRDTKEIVSDAIETLVGVLNNIWGEILGCHLGVLKEKVRGVAGSHKEKNEKPGASFVSPRGVTNSTLSSSRLPLAMSGYIIPPEER
jgi:hypothetical protein